MSRKNKALFAALVAATNGDQVIGSPIVEGLVNDKVVTYFNIYQVDAVTGRCMMSAMIGGQVRPLADSSGDLRIYASASATISVVNRNGGNAHNFYAVAKQNTVGDPVKALISRHKSMKSEDTKAGTAKTSVDGKVSAAAALGWDVAVGTPEADEYADLLARQTAVGEWKTYTAATLTTLTDSLTGAGINPVTYLPI